MRKYTLLNPGPANVTESVRKSLIQPDLCHREKEFFDIMQRVRKGLVKIVGGDERYTAIILTGSGTAAIEAVISSVYGKLLNIINGDYGKRIKKMAEIYDIDTVSLDFGWNHPDSEEIEETLKKDKKITHISVVHHETTNGMLNNIRAIGELAKKYNKTFIVDAMSSFAGEDLSMIEDNIDFCMSSSNKCIQGFPGLSFVIAKKSVVDELKGKKPRTLYLNLYNQYETQERNDTPFTPAVQAFYALDQAIKELEEEGFENRKKRYRKSAEILRKGLTKLGFKLLLPKELRCNILTTVILPKNMAYKTIHDKLKEKGYVVYAGKGTLDNNTFRIANMGILTSEDILKFLEVFEAVLDDLKIKPEY